MFATLLARVPRWARPLVWLIALPFRILGWALREMGTQAKAGAKRTLAPMLWPAAGILALIALYGALGPQGFQLIFSELLVLVLVLYGFKVMMFGFSKPKKERKKK